MQEYPIRWITSDLAVGYAPRSHNDLATIRNQGIAAIVNLCAECYDLYEIEKNAGFDVHFIPIPDEEAPTMESLEMALDWVTDCLDSGKKVLVHCRFGIGRTGTFVAAYLMRNGDSIKTALQKMEHTPSTPMSTQQFKLLKEYCDKLGLSKAAVVEAQSDMNVASDSFFKKWAAIEKWFETD